MVLVGDGLRLSEHPIYGGILFRPRLGRLVVIDVGSERLLLSLNTSLRNGKEFKRYNHREYL